MQLQSTCPQLKHPPVESTALTYSEINGAGDVFALYKSLMYYQYNGLPPCAFESFETLGNFYVYF